MGAFKNHVRKETDFGEYGVFNDIHIPLLVFQPNALLHVKKIFQVSRVDFIVLAAAIAILKKNYHIAFTSSQLREMVVGVNENVIYKCLTRLKKRGLIALKEERQCNRRFTITDRGKACIQSYVQSYNDTITKYPWYFQPECLK
jgi:predicted transcriptional regulator